MENFAVQLLHSIYTRARFFLYTLHKIFYPFTLTNVKTPYRDNPVETLDLKVFEVMYNNFWQRWRKLGKQLTYAYKKKKQTIWPQLFKRQIAVSTGETSVQRDLSSG